MAKATACKEIQGSRIPDLYGSINNTFKYKGFDLSILCTYSIGGKVLDGIYNTLLYGNYVGQAKSKMLERAWKIRAISQTSHVLKSERVTLLLITV